jgi:hypothetical protein
MEEATYAVSAGVAAARASAPDAAVAVSPSFLGLFPVLASARLRRFPWILWLEDILPDAAASTGQMREGLALRTAGHLERFSYRSADRIVVISNAFRENLLGKGVPPWKVTHVYNPYTRGLGGRTAQNGSGPARILYMGNMGFSQNLPALVRIRALAGCRDDVRLILAGTGELALRQRRRSAPTASRCRACCAKSSSSRWLGRPSGSSPSGPTSMSSTCLRSS